MSLILDALRKMEQERKARHGGTVDIRPAVLDRRGDEPSPKNRLMLVGAGAVLLLAGIGAGLLLRGAKTPPHSEPEQTAAAPAPRAAAPMTQTVAPLPVEPARAVPAAAAPPETPAPSTHSVPTDSQPPPSAERTDRGITISGIAWQDERNLRRAVINGSLVGEGAEIDGARVVEIRERSVRLSRGDRTFEVSYSSALPSR